jgi:hypothetical protein
VNAPDASLIEVGWLLMLIPLGVVLGIGVFVLYGVWRRRLFLGFFSDDGPAYAAGVLEAAKLGAAMAVFERPARWLAVKSRNAAAVQAALSPRRPAPGSRKKCPAERSAGKLFVAQPISGWVLVVGPGLPEPVEDVDDCYRFLRELSRKLGHVQFYSVNRALNQHAWALLEDGRVYRAYAWAGRTLWNEGSLTAAERELGMVCFDYGCEDATPALREAVAGDTEKLNQLAGRWSLDPAAIPPSVWRSQGIVGRVSQSRLY